MGTAVPEGASVPEGTAVPEGASVPEGTAVPEGAARETSDKGLSSVAALGVGCGNVEADTDAEGSPPTVVKIPLTVLAGALTTVV